MTSELQAILALHTIECRVSSKCQDATSCAHMAVYVPILRGPKAIAPLIELMVQYFAANN